MVERYRSPETAIVDEPTFTVNAERLGGIVVLSA
jgi:hypothetical protein